MFSRVLIANRGTIARRIVRTLRRIGVGSVAVYSEADAESLHVSEADEAICIGPAEARDSYLNVGAILDAARRSGAGAIHPGYGFLSENADFAERCEREGIAFLGPTAETIRAFGLKHTARALAEQAGVPILPGTALIADAPTAAAEAARIGFPVMLKATAGGGGIGMRACASAAEVLSAFDTVARLGGQNFGDGGVFIERLVRTARHVEVQVFGDGQGRVIALGERDCSLQRRNQKVIEETPAPLLPAGVRQRMLDAAIGLMCAVRYRSAGTVEFLYDSDSEEFYFLEVNTRLQVEHGVTEQVTGIDLVEWMVRCGQGDHRVMDQWRGERCGHSIEARLYAEDPAQGFRPSTGILTAVRWPQQARVETWVAAGVHVTSYYDPMIAKLIVTAQTREAAVRALQEALEGTAIGGLETNLDWLRHVVRGTDFTAGRATTRTLGQFEYEAAGIRVISGGLATTVQAYPGRLGFWHVGVPPSGPMDALALRLANRLVGNADTAAGLEITSLGPTLHFTCEAVLCLAGAPAAVDLDGAPVPAYEPFTVRRGQCLRIGRVSAGGVRVYLAVRGSFAVDEYLGSAATFTLGGFGGHAGRTLSAGDLLRIGAATDAPLAAPLPRPCWPVIARSWELRVLEGPHAAPDFFTAGDMAALYSVEWRVHYHSNRTGIRLVGPQPQWARTDGGEAGLHPSNIHDNAYAIGAVDFTGDMPIILGPDGPSLGGFVCPCVVIHADLWKLGQLAPGDLVRFVPTDEGEAQAAAGAQDALVQALQASAAAVGVTRRKPLPAVIARREASARRPEVVYRRQGDENLLVEYGPMVLDLELRIRVHALMLELERRSCPGIIDVTPGIRSLQVHFDRRRLTTAGVLDELLAAEERIGSLDDFEIPSRIVHLPLSWRDPAVDETIEKYRRAVRDDAPWCPDNIEFIRRVNGLATQDEVHRIVFDASYLVLGLGDVYLGAPVATPVDPRHRLVTTKYNPARTWTPPNVVGIGGAYLCIYGMEGPGGYQLFGRTIQVWNTFRQAGAFEADKPWLLRFFDQIRFFEVSAAELAVWRREFPAGRRALQIEHQPFRLADYRAFLAREGAGIAAFEARRGEAFAAERQRWREGGEFDRVAEALASVDSHAAAIDEQLPAGAHAVEAPFGGSVVRIYAKAGERIEAGAPLVVIEAMKTECTVEATVPGIVRRICVGERQQVSPGASLVILDSIS